MIDYKKAADKHLGEYLQQSVAARSKCDYFVVSDASGSSKYSYEANKSKRFIFLKVTFNYSIFEKALNESVYFNITVDKNFQIIRDSSIIKNVPACIRTAQPCYFITVDRAIEIAIADSIGYASNLSSQLEKNRFDNDYYWVVVGHKSSDTPKSDRTRVVRTAETISIDQVRIINAKTGQIIGSEKFYRDW